MSADAAVLEAVNMLSPRTLGRARRLALAISLLQQGVSLREARAQVKLRFSVCRREAWVVVNMAADCAGSLREEGGP